MDVQKKQWKVLLLALSDEHFLPGWSFADFKHAFFLSDINVVCDSCGQNTRNVNSVTYYCTHVHLKIKLYFPTRCTWTQHNRCRTAETSGWPQLFRLKDSKSRILKMFPNSDSRFSRIWFSSSSLPSQDIESPTGNLHFPQMKTTGPSSASPFSTAPNNFSSTVVESILETENVVFILFCRLLDAFFLVAIFGSSLQNKSFKLARQELCCTPTR